MTWLAHLAWKFVRRRLVGVIGRKGSDMYMYLPEDLEVIFRGRQCR